MVRNYKRKSLILNAESISQVPTTSTSTSLQANQQISSISAHNEIAHESTSALTSIIESLPPENLNKGSTYQPIHSTPVISGGPEDEPTILIQKDVTANPAAAAPMSTEFLTQPATSAHGIKEKTPERPIQPAKTSFAVTPENIIPIPKEVRSEERKSRKRGKTAILTASPYKQDLLSDINKKQENINKRQENINKKQEKLFKEQEKISKEQEKLNKATDKEESINKKTEKYRPETKKPEKKNKNKRRKKESDTDTSGAEDNDDKKKRPEKKKRQKKNENKRRGKESDTNTSGPETDDDDKKTEKNRPGIKKPGKKDKNKRHKKESDTDTSGLEDNDDEKKSPEKKKPQKEKKNKRRKKQRDTDSTSEDDVDDCPCIYCGYLYSQSTEGWVICSVCFGWAHNSCAGVDDDDEEAHICERCQPD